jgi:hypothetical protein
MTGTGKRVDAVVKQTVHDALGRGHRADPVSGRTGGPAGNARLTAWLGLLVLIVSVAELVTLLDVGGLIRWHVGIGIALTALALAKIGTTGWRMLRYYAGSADYVTAGPPPLLLRLLGPFVVLSTLGVLGTGFALIAIGRSASERTWFSFAGQQISSITLHQAFFVLFAVFATLHVLGRFVPAAVLVSGRTRIGGARTAVAGRALRFATISGGMVAALVAVTLILPTVADWNHHVFDRDDLHHSRSVSH